MALFDFIEEPDSMKGSTKYSRATKIPQYTPSENKPDIDSLTDVHKYTQLIGEINKSNLSDSEKAFLRLSATRHIVFNYDRIADYYANATPEMQRLMEKSALVIIDFDDAIANGYVKLSKRLEEIRGTYAKKFKDL